MRSLRSASLALVTAGALVLTAAPAAMAQEDTSSVSSSGSSAVGDALGANESERAIWGSSKDSEQVTAFGSSWYAYTIAATVAAIAGGAYAAAPAINQFLAEQGLNLQIPTF
ncbi:hypothetical protein COCCU_13795 [Corynebacterium occultum]|uniref:Secreted protein n=1 Tax=Corynebacterium occultum TaxID=2675219 RepID=A0A6B8W092_9CORY|nr:hypothetical protein [Corynebacterium occultum]QGU08649.1 hypothetical protein COCCU_13795 [Corynebacterium occultum]